MWNQFLERWSIFRKEFKLTNIHSGEQQSDRPWFNTAINGIWKLIMVGLLLAYLLLFLISFDNLPTFEELENPNYSQASLVFANDNSVLGKYYNENREFLQYDSLNPHLIHCLLSTEDLRFYSHSG